MQRLEPMTPGEAMDYAPQWGSYVRAGDPGACMYGDLTDSRTARLALDHIAGDCLPIARRGDCCDDPGEPCEDDVRELERLALYLEPIARRVWRVTYDVVTEESAALGDFAESGFLDGAGERVPARIGSPTPLVAMTLREALALWEDSASLNGWLEPDSSHGPVRSLRAAGETLWLTIHAPGPMTRASADRLARLLCGRLA